MQTLTLKRSDIDEVIKATLATHDKSEVSLHIKTLSVSLFEHFKSDVLPKLQNTNRNKAILFHEFLLHSKELLAN